MNSPNILTPMLALILWSFVIWFWMYATRLPAMRRAGIDPKRIKSKSDLSPLPIGVQQIADNYNHLHEQPTVFYALAVYTHLAGTVDALYVGLAWAYVVVRILHSLIQCTTNFVPVRFLVFVVASLLLMAIAVRNAMAILA